MTDDPKTQPTPPVQVAVIGTSGTGDGGLIGVTAVTPDLLPNLSVTKVVAPLMAILVRAGNTFFAALSGTVTANAFMHYGDFRMQVIIALTATGVGVVKDCATIFGKLEGKYPLLTGSI